ncbi:pyridoxamine 5'-phosphate oxidase family protein [uncultured Methanobrevibacter sp.]|uniref:pyridoxamine 5'-phosphate oxidase family protein n=1 Tax=uncultured Methanobrevibacter sp. TaxID=253161 RepID=UPI0025F2DA4F|nr:pyridoxamine 5'-phosphate oxidase family protein [uncultured Methanobrevibacter sp.]
MSNIKKVDDFLTDAEVFYLATVTEENKPKNRPLGFHMLVDDKIYFGVGTFKEVYKQMKQNPYVEVSATVMPRFIRYYGKVVFDDNPALIDKVFEIMPEIKELYEKSGWKMGVFHLEEATCEFRNMIEIEEKYEF